MICKKKLDLTSSLDLDIESLKLCPLIKLIGDTVNKLMESRVGVAVKSESPHTLIYNITFRVWTHSW